MVDINAILQKGKKIIMSDPFKVPERTVPDDVTTDKQLRSMRREKRTWEERDEKIHLSTWLADRKRSHASELLYGDGVTDLMRGHNSMRRAGKRRVVLRSSSGKFQGGR